MTTLGINLPGDLYLSDLLDTKWGVSAPLGKFISGFLPYLFIFGGMILLGMLVYGGFEMMTSLGNEEKFKGGAERVKNGLIGFLLLFGVYWLAQLAQVLFKIPIL